jgi:hypothetical protein
LILVIPKSTDLSRRKIPICEPISGSQNMKLSDAFMS